MTQEQHSDLRQYIPESDTVKAVFVDLHPEEDFKDWDSATHSLVNKAVGSNGDINAMFSLMELTYLNAHNEGMLESAIYEESYNGEG